MVLPSPLLSRHALEELVRQFADDAYGDWVTSRSKIREPKAPGLERPEAFISWGAASQFSVSSFRADAGRLDGAHEDKEEDLILHGTFVEEGRTWEDIEIHNPEDDSQSAIVRRTTAIALTSSVIKDGRPEQVKVSFTNSGEDQAPFYRNTHGKTFKPIVLDPWTSIQEVGWGGPFMVLIFAHYPETNMSGPDSDDPPKTLFGLQQSSVLNNPIDIEQAGSSYSFPATSNDKLVQYKSVFNVKARLAVPVPDPYDPPPDSRGFKPVPDDAVHLAFQQGHGPGGVLIGEPGGWEVGYLSGIYFLFDSSIDVDSTFISTKIPVSDDGSFEWRQDGYGAFVKMWYSGDGTPATTGGVVFYDRAYPADPGTNRWKITVFRKWQKVAPKPNYSECQGVGVLVNLSKPLITANQLVPGSVAYTLRVLYGGVNKNPEFKTNRLAALRLLVYARGAFDDVTKWLKDQSEAITAGDEPLTFGTIDYFMNWFVHPAVNPLQLSNQPILNVTRPENIYGPKYDITVNFEPTLDISVREAAS